MKLNASALYMVIVIALVIAVMCSSLIVSAYFFKVQYQRKFRYDRLQENLGSGINVALAGSDQTYFRKNINLFKNGMDSIILKRMFWGLYDVCVVQPYVLSDTLTAVFSVANKVDSTKWCALYLIDEDRPLSLSGKTQIKGNAYLPKAGVKEAYVDNNVYEGDKRLIQGKKLISAKQLPALDSKRLANYSVFFSQRASPDSLFYQSDSVTNSFDHTLRIASVKRKAITLSNKLNGYMLIRSDTTIIIDSSAKLNNVIIYAPSIIVKEGFKGICQLYTTDSIHIEKNCTFSYPSVIAAFRFGPVKNKTPEKIVIDNGVVIQGAVFTYQKENPELTPFIGVENDVKIIGQVYSQGMLNYSKNFEVDGSVFSSRFIYQSSYTRYENYLINVNFNSSKLSKYYLSGNILPGASHYKSVLQWLK